MKFKVTSFFIPFTMTDDINVENWFFVNCNFFACCFKHSALNTRLLRRFGFQLRKKSQTGPRRLHLTFANLQCWAYAQASITTWPTVHSYHFPNCRHLSSPHRYWSWHLKTSSPRNQIVESKFLFRFRISTSYLSTILLCEFAIRSLLIDDFLELIFCHKTTEFSLSYSMPMPSLARPLQLYCFYNFWNFSKKTRRF